MDVSGSNANAEARILQHPRNILHAAICIASSAFLSIGFIVWMLR
jgi:hypothetical protein